MTLTEEHNIICDGSRCGVQRKNDTNHWWVAWTEGDMVNIRALKSFNYEAHEDLELKHFCGQECLMKWTSKALSDMRG